MQPVHNNIIGNSSVQEDRLCIHGVSFWLMESCLILLVFIAFGLCFFSNPVGLPRDPTPIGSLAMILINSDSFAASLSGTGAMPDEELRDRLKDQHFWTAATEVDHTSTPNTFQLHSSGLSGTQPTNPYTSGITAWFHPLSTSYLYIFGVPVILLALIIALELLFRLSEDRMGGGLVAVPGVDGYTHLAWTYLPALVMIAAGSLVSPIHSAAKILQPYAILEGWLRLSSQLPAEVSVQRLKDIVDLHGI